MTASLRNRLGRALLVALSPVLAMGAVGAGLNYRDEGQDRRDLLEATALRSAAEARSRIESGTLVLSALTPEFVGPDCPARLRAVVARLPGYLELSRVDAQGRPVCASRAQPYAARDIGWLRRLREGASTVLTAGDPHGATEPEVLIAASRVEGPGGFDGAFVSVIALSSLRPALDAAALPAGAELAVVGGGELVASRNPDAFPEALPAPGGERSARLFRGEDRAGQTRDYAAARLAGDSYLVLSAPAPGLFSWARLNPLFSVILPLLAFGAAFAAVWLAADRLIIRWLNYLQRIAAVYARGRFTVRPTISDDAPAEVHALARTLDEMADTIVKRDQTVQDNLAQKDALLREIHHRVKNNLQVITSLLNLQQRALADPAGRAVLADTRQRITALALIYRALYQSEDLRRVDVRSFLEELVAHLVSAESSREGPIRAEVQADELMLDPDKLAPFALFAVEAVSNAQKHAFPQAGGTIRVRFSASEGEGRLSVEDDGVGAEAASGEQSGVGRTLMNAFARQLRGRSELQPLEGGGMAARLVFPLPDGAPHAPAAQTS